MTDFPQPCPQQYFDEDQFQVHGNSSAAGVSWSVTASMFPQDPQSAPSSNPRPLPGQPWGHDGILQDDMVSDWYYMFPICESPRALAVLLVPTNECCW